MVNVPLTSDREEILKVLKELSQFANRTADILIGLNQDVCSHDTILTRLTQQVERLTTKETTS